MTKENELYKCEICGNVVSVLEQAPGELVCCGKPMNLIEEKTQDEGKEKHVPVIETIEGGIKVKIGSVAHPMTKEHHIKLIQIIKNEKVLFGKRLNPEDVPEVEFLGVSPDGITARAFCNVHGLWKN